MKLLPTLLLSLLVVSVVAGWGSPRRVSSFEDLTLEIHVNASDGEATLLLFMEAVEEITGVEFHGPGGETLMTLDSSQPRSTGIYEMVMESKAPLEVAWQAFPEGVYSVLAETRRGTLYGTVELSHDLPHRPHFLDQAVTIEELGTRLRWRLHYEAGLLLEVESDDVNLSYRLDSDLETLLIPFELLDPSEPFQVSLSSIGENGNRVERDLYYEPLQATGSFQSR